MSVQEIEQAISELSPSDIDRLVEWIERHRQVTESESNRLASTRPQNLADAMGSLIGAVGRDSFGESTSSRNAGSVFAQHLVKKKQGRTL